MIIFVSATAFYNPRDVLTSLTRNVVPGQCERKQHYIVTPKKLKQTELTKRPEPKTWHSKTTMCAIRLVESVNYFGNAMCSRQDDAIIARLGDDFFDRNPSHLSKFQPILVVHTMDV